MKKHITIAVALVLAPAHSFAVEQFITKSKRPDRIVTAKAGVGLAQFPISSTDFPTTIPLYATKRLQGISWSTTYYPENLKEEVYLCYFRPIASSPEPCKRIAPNSSGIAHEFDSLPFDKYAKVMIRHKVEGGKDYGTPAGEDTITVKYSY